MTDELLVMLPQNVEALDQFVSEIIYEYKLPEGEDTYDAIATMIMHLNHTTAYATKKYFADGVRKSLANKAAYEKLCEFREKREAAKKEQEAKKAAEKTDNNVIPITN
jgi:hypothetical protein